MNFQSLPIIDFSSFLDPSSTPQQKQEVAQKIHHSCCHVGFFYLKGHGISQTLIDDVFEQSKLFFSLPQNEKDEISITKSNGFRGYQRLGENVTKYQKDWHEGIDFFNQEIKDNSNHFPFPFPYEPNLWPKKPPQFQSKLNLYIEEMKKLGTDIMKALALGLSLNEDFFDPYTNESFWGLRVIGYPPLQSSGEKTGVGKSCGEHSDYGCITILNQDSTKGALRVKNSNGEWINADPIPGTFVINLGDMMKIWTNGLYQSTPHEVIHHGNNYRISLPFFFEPNFFAKIEPLNVLSSPIVEPIRYCDHVYKKVSNNFSFEN